LPNLSGLFRTNRIATIDKGSRRFCDLGLFHNNLGNVDLSIASVSGHV